MKVFRRVTPGTQPRHRDPRRADRGRQRARRRALRLGRGRRRRPGELDGQLGDAPGVPARPPATAGSSRWPACATCSPRRTVTRRRGRRRLRRRGRAARRGGRGGARRRWPSASRPRRRTPSGSAALADAMRPGSRRRCPSYPSSARARRRRCTRSSTRSRHLDRRRSRPSACTATSTSGRPCAPCKGWKIIDFEGEPAKPLAERTAARLPAGATWPACCGRSTTRRELSRIDHAQAAGDADEQPPTGRASGRSATARRSSTATREAAAAPSADEAAARAPTRRTRPSTRPSTRPATAPAGCRIPLGRARAPGPPRR